MKYYGQIGFELTEETSPGIWNPTISERNYYGDVLQNIRRWETGVSINDNIKIQNRISVIADPFLHSNLGNVKYIVFAGNKWKISSFDVQYPRVIFTIGEIYNEQTSD